MNILMTGGNGGIGSVIKSLLTENSYNVKNLSSKELDLSEEINSIHEDIDGLIYCAGVNILKKFDDINYEEFNKLLNINTINFIKLCSTVKFNPNANIIAIGSLYSQTVKPYRTMYAVSKHGLLASVKTMALELSKQNIKVNMISPGFLDTALTRKNNSETRIKELNDLIPLGLTNPDEIAKMCLYLVKDNNSITGQNIIIDGGYSCMEP